LSRRVPTQVARGAGLGHTYHIQPSDHIAESSESFGLSLLITQFPFRLKAWRRTCSETESSLHLYSMGSGAHLVCHEPDDHFTTQNETGSRELRHRRASISLIVYVASEPHRMLHMTIGANPPHARLQCQSFHRTDSRNPVDQKKNGGTPRCLGTSLYVVPALKYMTHMYAQDTPRCLDVKLMLQVASSPLVDTSVVTRHRPRRPRLAWQYAS
jgi:hypothetical protein